MSFNPFDDSTTTVSFDGLRPRVRVAEINETNVVLVVEAVDADGHTVLQFQRACLRAGDTLTLNDIVINLSVKTKE